MDFYLIAESDKTEIRFPINPEKVTAETGARMQSLELLEIGEVAWPKGTKLARISWESFFPGQARAVLPMVKYQKDGTWLSPKHCVDMLQDWRNSGERLRLLVTETPLNLYVYIEDFEHTWLGGFGDCQCKLSLVQAKSVVAHVDGEQTASTKAQPRRPSPPPSETYVVKRGDTLSQIAKRTTGSMKNWQLIYNTNRQTIGPNPNNIQIGMVLRIPKVGG